MCTLEGWGPFHRYGTGGLSDGEDAKAQRWRRLLIPETSDALESTSGLESVAVDDGPLDRVASAKEAMHRMIKDRFGGDEALSKAVDQLAITSEEAIAVLDAAAKEPTDDHFASLEAIVAFDGTRPSFLVKKQEIDFHPPSTPDQGR